MMEWFRKVFRARSSWTYRVLHFPGLGYLPVHKLYGDMYSIDRHGCSCVSVDSAPRYKDLFHETEASAGEALNLHATSHGFNVVWEG